MVVRKRVLMLCGALTRHSLKMSSDIDLTCCLNSRVGHEPRALRIGVDGRPENTMCHRVSNTNKCH